MSHEFESRSGALAKESQVRNVRRGVLAAALVVMGVGTAVAQQAGSAYQPADWNRVVESANREGKVTLYTAAPPQVNTRLTQGFKSAFPGIVIEAISASSAQLLPRIQRELASGVDGADVFITTDLGWILQSGKEGKLLKPSGPATTGWPERFMRDNVVTGAIVVNPIAYNKNLVPNPPKGYADLLKPEFKGKLGTIEMQGSYIVAWYDWLERTQGTGFLAKLREQNPKTYGTGIPMTQAAAAGEIAVAVFATTATYASLVESGAPLGMVVPNPILGSQYGMAGFSTSKRQNAALVLLDFLMSRPGQMLWHSSGGTGSALPNIPGAMELPNITFWSPSDYPPEVMKQHMDRWNKLFK